MVLTEFFAKLGLDTDAQSFLKGGLALEGIKKGLNFIVDAAKAVTHELVGMVTETAETADMFYKAAQSTGVNSIALQELAYAADLADVSFDSLRGGLKFLNSNLYEATQGSKEAAKAFDAIGIDPKQYKSADEALGDIAEKFSKMPDGIKKSALARKVFGRGGDGLIPLLNEGKKGLGELREEFNRLGLTLDGNVQKQGEDLNDTIKRMEYAWKGIKQQIGAELIPIVVDIGHKMFDWVMKNRELIKQKVKGFIDGLISAGKTLIKVYEEMKKVVNHVKENWQFFTVVLGAVALAYGLIELKAMLAGKASAFAGIKAAAAWIAATWPILAIVAVIFILILAVQDLWAWFSGGESVIKDLIYWIGGKLKEVWDGTMQFFKDAFTGFYDWIIEKFTSIGKTIKSTVKSAISWIPGVGDLPIDAVPQVRRGIAGIANFNKPSQSMGGGASPSASAGMSSVKNQTNNTTITAPITINAAPGQSETDIASEVAKQMGNALQSQNEDAFSSVQ